MYVRHVELDTTNESYLPCLHHDPTSILPMNLTSLVLIMIVIVLSIVIVCVLVAVSRVIAVGIMAWEFCED
jgi:hypothetical protein